MGCTFARVGVAAGLVSASLVVTACLCTPKNVSSVAVIEVPPDHACPRGDDAKRVIVDAQGDIEEVSSGPTVTEVPGRCCYADPFAPDDAEICIDVDGADLSACPASEDAAGIASTRAVVRWRWPHVACTYAIIDHDWVDVCG